MRKPFVSIFFCRKKDNHKKNKLTKKNQLFFIGRIYDVLSVIGGLDTRYILSFTRKTVELGR